VKQVPFPNQDAQWQKGQTGNPNGRPKKLPDLDRLMEKIMGEEKDGITAVEAILKRLRQKAAQGDTKAANALLDRAYGKPKQRTEITGAEGEKLTVNFNLNPRRRETPQEAEIIEKEDVREIDETPQ
jgi:hypothetical protein